MAGNDIRDRIKELRRVRASELQAHPLNWRKHPKAQRDALAAVLGEIGYADALLAYEPVAGGGLVLIDGHLRAETTPETEVPVLVLDVDDAEASKILATLDPLAAMAESDADKLDEILRDVQTGSEALAEMLESLAEDAGCEWAGRDGNAAEVVEDEVPEPPVEPTTKPGDLWVMGEHRLLCGDSTVEANVKRVLSGAKACCVFTDPPYGVSQAAKNRVLNECAGGRGGNAKRNETDIVDDDLTPEELEARLLPSFVNTRTIAMAEDCTLFMSAPQGGELGMMMMMMKKAGLPVRHVLIWKKNQPTFSMGRLDYDYQHEPILLTWGKRHKRPMAGTHKTSVWEIDKPRKSEEHPTMKPVELYANAYLNNSEAGDNVYEPYAGSGTAFVAAEQVGRKCYGIEISPAYCDIIVKRWETLTGRKATLEPSSPSASPSASPSQSQPGGASHASPPAA